MVRLRAAWLNRHVIQAGQIRVKIPSYWKVCVSLAKESEG